MFLIKRILSCFDFWEHLRETIDKNKCDGSAIFATPSYSKGGQQTAERCVLVPRLPFALPRYVNHLTKILYNFGST